MSTSPDSSKPSIDNRHLFRQFLVQSLYELNFNKEYPENEFERLTQADDYSPEYHLDFDYLSHKIAKKVMKMRAKNPELAGKVMTRIKEADEIIQKYAPEWPIDQINPVDLQILRLAIYEGFLEPTIPAKVAIDEAIELAKDFGAESDSKFVSGVLGQVYTDREKLNLQVIEDESDTEPETK